MLLITQVSETPRRLGTWGRRNKKILADKIGSLRVSRRCFIDGCLAVTAWAASSHTAAGKAYRRPVSITARDNGKLQRSMKT